MTFFWIIFMVFGLIGLGVGLELILTGINSTRWPTTRGRIVTSEITMEYRPNHDTTYYHPEVTYTYSVAGQEYQGRQVSVGDHDSDSVKSARKITDKYFRTMDVEVFYDPNDPSNALLEPGFRFSSVLIFMAGAVFFIAAILGLFGIIGGKGSYSF